MMGWMLHIQRVTSETFLDKADGQPVTQSNFRIVDCIGAQIVLKRLAHEQV